MLSKEQVDQYRSQGYCVFSELLSEKEVLDLLTDMNVISAGATLANHDASRLEMEPNQPPDGQKVRRIYEPCAYYDRFRALSESAKLVDCVEQLIGSNILYTSSKVNMKPSDIGSVVEWHQDMTYGPVTNTDVLAVLLYLDDADLKRLLAGNTRQT